MKALKQLEYNGKAVSFQNDGKNVMVNATEMAKIFGKEVTHFLENENTKRFIESCLKTRNSEFLGINNKTDLIIGRQRKGTWMHKVLALKFASWLDSDFELWVYSTIEALLSNKFQALESNILQTKQIKNEIIELENYLLGIPDYVKLNELQRTLRLLNKDRNKIFSNQVALFG